MKTKVVIVIDSLGPGGAQRQVAEYLKFADRGRFDIKVVNLDKHYDTLAGEIKSRGYEVIGIEHRGFLNLWTILRLVRLFKTEKPDIVYTYLFTADCYGRLAAKLAGVPVIISAVRNIDAWKGFRHILVDKVLGSWTDRVTVNAQGIKPFLRKSIPLEKIVTIYNGVDLDRLCILRNPPEVRKELGIPDGAFVVGMVARFSEQKDYRTFFQAAKLVIQEIPNAYFLAVGEGVLKYRAVEIVQELGICSNVIFTGLRKDVPDVVNSFDVGVLASHYEGCSNAIMEYMACAKAVAASNVGGNAELVREGVTGYIVEPKNAQALAEKIIALLKDKTLREKMGQAGRTRIEREFTVQKMAKNTEEMFEQLARGKAIKKDPVIVYLLSQFPETHETFILREIKALKEQGVCLKILSLKPCRDTVIHPDAERMIAETVYGRVDFFCSVSCVLRHPLKVLSAFGYILKAYWENPREFIKGLYVLAECLYFVQALKKDKLRHIHSHWATMPTTAAVILSRLTGVAFSFTAHAWDIFVNSNGLTEKIKRAKFAVTCTDYNRKYLSGLNGKSSKIYLNYHGLDLNEFGFSRTDIPQVKILSIGRLVETKGFSYLIKACEMLRKKGIEFSCDIVGQGPRKDFLQLQVACYNLENRVRLLGIKSQEEIKRLYVQASLFVLPCVVAEDGDRDGIPNVFLEAMAMGLPVIATDVSGIPEAVQDRETGLLVPPKDSFALTDAIIELYSNEDLKTKITANARELVERQFDVRKNIRALMGIYRDNGVLDKKEEMGKID
ncbi:MAG: glycosyltransferase [Candidatus Omnitrophota bacterium]